MELRRRKRFKRSEDEKKVITAYLQGDQNAIHAAEHMLRTQQPYTPSKLTLEIDLETKFQSVYSIRINDNTLIYSHFQILTENIGYFESIVVFGVIHSTAPQAAFRKS